MKKLTTERFIERSRQVHGDIYDYSEVTYLGATKKVNIQCRTHGLFAQNAHSHMKGMGCPTCARLTKADKRRSFNVNNFVEQCVAIHPELDFSNTVYFNAKTPVQYICKKHGVKSTYPYNLLKGYGCKNCSSSTPKVKRSVWLERFNGLNRDNIDYSKIPDTFNRAQKLIFICKKHGEFLQTAGHHLVASCPTCGRDKTNSALKSNPTGWKYSNWERAAKRSKKFDSYKVYVLKCWGNDELFYKIGKTYHTIYDRFRIGGKSKMPYEYSVVKLFVCKTARQACELEYKLKNESQANRYAPRVSFQGWSECFSTVDARYTSQTCNACGSKDKASRISQSRFVCTACGVEANADDNAAQNIKGRGTAIVRKRSGLPQALDLEPHRL